MGVNPTMLGRAALVLLLVSFALPGPAWAEPTEAERMARWADLRHAIFGNRVVEDAGDLVAIDAPVRAEDAAIVPVAIRVAEMLAPEIRGLYLVIDNNPSPLAAHFILGPIAEDRVPEFGPARHSLRLCRFGASWSRQRRTQQQEN